MMNKNDIFRHICLLSKVWQKACAEKMLKGALYLDISRAFQAKKTHWKLLTHPQRLGIDTGNEHKRSQVCLKKITNVPKKDHKCA